MSAVVPLEIAGRPVRPFRYLQRLVTRSRCQRSRVAGLDEVASEMLAAKELHQPGQDRSVGRLQRRSVDLASEDRHLEAQHAEFDREVCVTATGEQDHLKGAA